MGMSANPKYASQVRFGTVSVLPTASYVEKSSAATFFAALCLRNERRPLNLLPVLISMLLASWRRRIPPPPM